MVYQSLQSITEDRQSWGSGRIYTDYYTAPTITNRHEKKLTNPLCSGGVLVSVVAVLAAAACDSVATRACCHRLPFSVPDHQHAASLLFCSGNAAGVVFCVLLLIPF